jgi:hypothetical protein
MVHKYNPAPVHQEQCATDETKNAPCNRSAQFDRPPTPLCGTYQLRTACHQEEESESENDIPKLHTVIVPET